MDDKHPDPIKKRGPDRETWCVVAYAVGMTDAEIPAGLLRTAGIPVYLFREALASSALPLSVGRIGGVQVAVPETFYAEAMALLDDEYVSPDHELEPPDAADEET